MSNLEITEENTFDGISSTIVEENFSIFVEEYENIGDINMILGDDANMHNEYPGQIADIIKYRNDKKNEEITEIHKLNEMKINKNKNEKQFQLWSFAKTSIYKNYDNLMQPFPSRLGKTRKYMIFFPQFISNSNIQITLSEISNNLFEPQPPSLFQPDIPISDKTIKLSKEKSITLNRVYHTPLQTIEFNSTNLKQFNDLEENKKLNKIYNIFDPYNLDSSYYIDFYLHPVGNKHTKVNNNLIQKKRGPSLTYPQFNLKIEIITQNGVRDGWSWNIELTRCKYEATKEKANSQFRNSHKRSINQLM